MKKILLKIAFLLFISMTTKGQLWSQTKEVFVLSPKLSKHAEYPEGQAALYNFIQKNLKYPKSDTTPIKGTVYLNFCVESDGRITNINLVKGFHPQCDEEAKRVFSIMPKWTPAVEAGSNKPVRSFYTLPCRFHGK
jgi:periplasmic protein TonB